MATFRPTEPTGIHNDIMLRCMGDATLVEQGTGHTVTIPAQLHPEDARKTIASFCAGCAPEAHINVVSSGGSPRMQWPPIRR